MHHHNIMMHQLIIIHVSISKNVLFINISSENSSVSYENETYVGLGLVLNCLDPGKFVQRTHTKKINLCTLY